MQFRTLQHRKIKCKYASNSSLIHVINLCDYCVRKDDIFSITINKKNCKKLFHNASNHCIYFVEKLFACNIILHAPLNPFSRYADQRVETELRRRCFRLPFFLYYSVLMRASVASREIRNMPMRRYAHEICNGPSRNASGNGWNSWSCSDHPSGSAGHAGRVFRNESNAVLPRLDYVYERIARARL